MSNTIAQVCQTVIGNMYTYGWNPHTALKNHNGTWTPNIGGFYINWEDSGTPLTLNHDTQVNENDPDQTMISTGLTNDYSHDPQVCLTYLRSVAQYKVQFPSDTRFDQPNASGTTSVSQMVDHLTLSDFAPATNSTNGGYNNPKGWIYYAWLDIWLALKNSPLLTAGQVTNIQNSLLYQAFTYINHWYSTSFGGGIFLDTNHNTYQPSQSLYMAAAVYDASVRFASSIVPNMFYDSTPFSPQTPAGWQAAAIPAAKNVLSRGAYNTTAQYFYGSMTAQANSSTDLVGSVTAKVDDVSEDAVAMIYLYHLTGDTFWTTYIKPVLNSIDAKTWDGTYGGYFAQYNLSTMQVVNAYKECKATAHMLYAYTLYHLYVNSTEFGVRISAIQNALKDLYYKTKGIGGYYFRVQPDATGSVYIDHFTPDFSLTLAAPANIGNTSIQVTTTSSKFTQTYLVVVNLGAANQEMLVLDTQSVSGSGPYTLPCNQGTNAVGHVQKNHLAGEPLYAFLAPTPVGSTNPESQYTTEACTNICFYLLNSLTNQAVNVQPPQSDGSAVTTNAAPLYSPGGPEILRMGVRRPSLLQIFEMDIEDLVGSLIDFFDGL